MTNDNSPSLISWNDFEKVELRAGTIVEILDFPEAKKPALKLKIDFGTLGTRMSSAQITKLYDAQSLIGRQVLCVVNFPKKQIGPFQSEVLTCGFIRAKRRASGLILYEQDHKELSDRLYPPLSCNFLNV